MKNIQIARHNKNIKTLTVVIIGAGAAGLAAAKSLFEAGHDVTVLEANNYIGGRIKALELDRKTFVEVGASLIHHRRGPLYQRAKKNRILTSKTGRWDKTLFIVDDERISMLNILLRSRFADLFKVGKLFKGLMQYDGVDLPVSDKVCEFQFSDGFKKIFFSGLEITLGAQLENIGARSLIASLAVGQVKIDSDLIGASVSKRFSWFIQPYINAIEPCIKLNSAVSEIDYADNSQGSDGTVKIKLDNGQEYAADRVIITASLGVLKSGVINFMPSLPSKKQQAIQSLGMGQGLKAVIRFNKRLWPTKLKYILDCDQHILYMISTYHVYDFSMVAFITDEMISKKSDKQVEKIIRNSLKVVFSDSDINACLIEIMVHNWSNQKYFDGIYSYDKVGSIGCRKILAESISNKIYFAGEATIDGFFASVDGAILSGERAAQEIIGETNTISDDSVVSV